ncbi:hypothetical protein EXU85_05180 [Spirosoma sp. KCTC 42546]|uniref:hypothetical protein n=1 Tax=Spirosoma sp. KCTC 42546 TaxID=2520506 RepID=UPI001158371A|nr:hypothetical protein [Spirosoma sp. KCTC 42546]QDK78014.1 hypothetical protein EXU85_05180 [Spirosoma sp. KCTC 42546]
MMNTLTGLAFGLTLLASGCQSTSSEHHHPDSQHKSIIEGPVAELEKQVLATHDSLMPQMSELIRLKKAVTLHLEKTTDATDAKRGIAVTAQLDSADHLMTDWMHEYNGDTLKQLDQTRALAYLKAEQTKVNALRDKMRKSIAEATSYLD